MESSLKELAKMRFERALEDLEVAQQLFDSGNYRVSLNRSYYAIFHAIRSVNSLDRFDSSKHSGVISHFNLTYIKTGIFDKKLTKIIRDASEYRENADYEDFFVASKPDAEKILSSASVFIEQIRSYLQSLDVL